MNLEQLGKRDARLAGLLQQSQQWRRLDAAVKRILPANLHPHFQTACIEEGSLVMLAGNGMAASRLKAEIRDVVIKVVPKPLAQPKVNSLHLSGAALESFDAAAAKLEDKHPELAAALAELVRKHSR